MLQTRTLLLEIVARLPGIRFLELARRTGLANGVLAYHLGILERDSLLKSDRGQGHAEFYSSGFAKADVSSFAMIRHDRTREIIQHLLQYPDSTHGVIAQELGCAPSTASWYLARLQKANVVSMTNSGRLTLYRLVDPDRIRRLMVLYRETWQDVLVDRFASIWDDNNITLKK